MDRTQPTPIDAEEYEKFRQFVIDVHGSARGTLRTEIENALRQYRESYYGESHELTRIEDDIATIKAAIAEESDGGTAPAPSSGESTRARSTDKPAPNQPRSEKIDYLFRQLIIEYSLNQDSGQVSKSQIRELIQSEYNFNNATVDDYYNALVRKLDGEEHPIHGKTIAWGDKLEEIYDSQLDRVAE